MIVGIMDYDYFTYWNTMPNLECAKLLAYYKKKKDITLLAPKLEPERYSQFYIRKDYEDRKYPKEFFLPNVSYGGRAMSQEKYIPFPLEIEKVIPDFSPYEKYLDFFGKDVYGIKRILRAAHCRLSTNGKDIDNFVRAQLQIFPNTSGIIIHDYHPEQVIGAVEFLKEISNSRTFAADPTKIRPVPIGMKYPPVVRTKEELYKWIDLPPLLGVFQVQYDGLMPDSFIKELCDTKQEKKIQKIIYNPFATISSNEEAEKLLDVVYRQCLYLSSHQINFLLTLGKNFSLSREIENLFRLWNEFFLSKVKKQGNTLFFFVRAKVSTFSAPLFTEKSLSNRTTIEENKKSFMYCREKNYKLFKMFYETLHVHYEKGEFVDD